MDPSEGTTTTNIHYEILWRLPGNSGLYSILIGNCGPDEARPEDTRSRFCCVPDDFSTQAELFAFVQNLKADQGWKEVYSVRRVAQVIVKYPWRDSDASM